MWMSRLARLPDCSKVRPVYPRSDNLSGKAPSNRGFPLSGESDSMSRLNRIIENKDFGHYLEKIEQLERRRRFCRHGFDHALAVARIAYAYLLEQSQELPSVEYLPRDVVYAAGLLHDIGRWIEYETGEDHAEAGSRLARSILQDSGYDVAEQACVLTAIREHRGHGQTGLTRLGRALALADDWARDCRHCPVRDDCHKFKGEMLEIVY